MRQSSAKIVVASAYLDDETIWALGPAGPKAARILRETPRGISVVVGPAGLPVGDTLCEAEGLLYHEIDLGDCVEPNQFHYVVGYYNRFDTVRLTLDRSADTPMTCEETARIRQVAFDPPTDAEPAPAIVEAS